MARLHMQGLHRVPNMFDYRSIRLNNNASVCVNVTQYV